MLFPTARTLMSVVLLAGAAGATAQPSTPPARVAPPSIEAKTAGMQKLDGFVPLYWDEAEGRVYLEIARFGVEMLHSNGFASGLGSNDIGLDRGALAGSRIVTFERVGPKVLLVQPNYDFRASSTNPEEVRAVRDAFARSVLWGFTVAAESEGRVLVDATEWLVRDNLNLAPRLRPGQLQARREAQQPLPRRAPSTSRRTPSSRSSSPTCCSSPRSRRRVAPRPGPAPTSAAVATSRAWATWPRAARPRACASTTPSSSCRSPATGRASWTRAAATSASRTRSARRASTSRSSGSSSPATGSRRRTLAPSRAR